MKIKGKTVVVTGGGSGMGRELVLQLLKQGARVATVDVNAESLAETQRMAGVGPDQLLTLTGSVGDRAFVEALPEKVAAALGPTDGIINNAGIIQPFVRLKDLEWSAIDRVMQVNWSGTLYMVKSFLPGLLQRPDAHVVNIASMGGFLPVPGQSIYGASKAAVKLMTEALYAEVQGTNLHVTVVFPGAVATNITTNSGVTIKGMDASAASKHKTTSASDAATQILEGMEDNAFRVLVGSDAKFMDKLYRLNPQRAVKFIAKQMKDLLGT
jgi:short-subunit dehydrogenase